MARLFRLDRGNLIKKLQTLEKERILSSEVRGNQKYYSLNKKYPLLKEYKKIILKTIGFEKRLRDLLAGLRRVKKVFIFGSYAKDKLDISSDIDILVIGEQDTIALQKRIAKLQSQIEREINVISMGEKEFQRKREKDPFVRNILRQPKIEII
jgi:predicted nucleotidyltransferase